MVAGGRQRRGGEPHAERLQRRRRQVDPRRQGHDLVQQPRRPEGGGAQSGGAQADVYAMFFTHDAWDRFRLTQGGLALVKESRGEARPSPKGLRTRAKAPRRDKDAPPNRWSPRPRRPDQRKARLTIHSSSLGDALVSKDGETLYYLARFEKGMNLWTTNLRTQGDEDAARRSTRAAAAWPGTRTRRRSSSSPTARSRRSTRRRRKRENDGDPRRDGARRGGRARATCSSTCGGAPATRSTPRGYHGIDWDGPQAGVRASTCPHLGDELRVRRDAQRDARRAEHQPQRGALRSASEPTDDATASLGIFYDQAYAGPGVKVDEVIARRAARQGRAWTCAPATMIEAIDGETGHRRPRPRRAPQPQGRQADPAARDSATATTSEIVVKPITPVRRGPAALHALGAAEPGGGGPPQRRPARLHPHARHERRRLPHRVRGGDGQVRRPEGASWWTRASTAAATWWPTSRCS